MKEVKNTQLQISKLLDDLLNHCDILIEGNKNKGDWSEPFNNGVYAVRGKISHLKNGMITDSENQEDSNDELVSGYVKVLKTPISQRYCKVGDEAILDVKNKKIRCSGACFDFDERWSVEPCH